MRLSVIIPCYNAASVIADQLSALAGQSWKDGWEVIVADNGSTDDSVRIAECYADRFPSLRVVDASRQRGAAFARNVGASHARGEALVFTDADDVVAPGWLEAMGNALIQHEFVACRLIPLEDPHRPPDLGRSDGPQNRGLLTFRFPPYFPYAGGGTIGVRKELFDRLGGFDASLLYLEDNDFCLRAQLEGSRLQFVPDAVIQLRRPATLSATFRQSRSWACYDVLLAQRYRFLGSRPNPWRRYIGGWLALARYLPNVRTFEGRRSLARRLGHLVGTLQGCFLWGGPPV